MYLYFKIFKINVSIIFLYHYFWSLLWTFVKIIWPCGDSKKMYNILAAPQCKSVCVVDFNSLQGKESFLNKLFYIRFNTGYNNSDIINISFKNIWIQKSLNKKLSLVGLIRLEHFVGSINYITWSGDWNYIRASFKKGYRKKSGWIHDFGYCVQSVLQ